MKNRRCLAIILMVVTLIVPAEPSGARELKGVDFPDQIQLGSSTLVLNGLGIRQATAFKVNVYVAGLYLAERSSDAQAILQSAKPKCLVLHFLRSVDSSELNDAWDEGFRKNAADQIPVLESRIEEIKSFTKDMKAGQKLVFTYNLGEGIVASVDGVVVGTVKGDDFAKAFLSIWLGPHPPNEDLKKGLLGISNL